MKYENNEGEILVVVPFVSITDFRNNLKTTKFSELFRGRLRDIHIFAKGFYCTWFKCIDENSEKKIGFFTDGLSGTSAYVSVKEGAIKTEKYDRARLGTVLEPEITLEEVVKINKAMLERTYLKKRKELPLLELEDSFVCYRVFYLTSFSRSRKQTVYSADYYGYL